MNLFKKVVKDSTLNNNINLLQKLKTDIRQLRQLYGDLNQYPISHDIKEICKIADKITKEISLHQEKIMKVNMFVDYYIPTTIKLLTQYLDIKENKLTGDENEKIIVMIEETLPKIKMAFEELLNQLFSEDNKDIDVEIKVLMNELKKWME